MPASRTVAGKQSAYPIYERWPRGLTVIAGCRHPGVVSWKFAHRSEAGLALPACGLRSRSRRRASHRLSLTQRTSQWPPQAVDGQPAAHLACRTGVWRGSRKWIHIARLRRSAGDPAPGQRRGGAFAEHDGDRNRGNSSDSRFLTSTAAKQGRGKHTAALQNDGSYCLDGAKAGGSGAPKPSSGRLLVAARADWSARCSCSLGSCWTSIGSRGGAECPYSEWLALALGYQGTLFPMFCVGWSYGSALPGSAGADLNPYTTVHPQRAWGRSKRRACARRPEMARMRCEILFPVACSGVPGAQGDGSIQGDAAALELLDFLEGNEALVRCIRSYRSAALERSVLVRNSRPRRAASRRIWYTASRVLTWAVWVMGCYISKRGG